MRSLIIAPGDDEARLRAALKSGADAVVIDLAVAPDLRAKARAGAARLLAKARAVAPSLLVRVNPLERFAPRFTQGSLRRVSSPDSPSRDGRSSERPTVGEDQGRGSRRTTGQSSSGASNNSGGPRDRPPRAAPTSGGGGADAIDSTEMLQAPGYDETDLDLDAVMPHAPFAIVLPRALAPGLQQLSARLAVREADASLEDGSTRIVAVADTAEALIGLAGARARTARLVGVAWDAEALKRDIGAEVCRDESGAYAGPWRLARDLTLLAATAVGVAAIDAPSAGLRDPKALREEALAARRDGFAAKLALDPDQVKIINEAFGAAAPAPRSSGNL